MSAKWKFRKKAYFNNDCYVYDLEENLKKLSDDVDHSNFEGYCEVSKSSCGNELSIDYFGDLEEDQAFTYINIDVVRWLTGDIEKLNKSLFDDSCLWAIWNESIDENGHRSVLMTCKDDDEDELEDDEIATRKDVSFYVSDGCLVVSIDWLNNCEEAGEQTFYIPISDVINPILNETSEQKQTSNDVELEYEPSEEEVEEFAKQLEEKFSSLTKREPSKPKNVKWLSTETNGYLGFVNVVEEKGNKTLIEVPESCNPYLEKEEREFEVLTSKLEDM